VAVTEVRLDRRLDASLAKALDDFTAGTGERDAPREFTGLLARHLRTPGKRIRAKLLLASYQAHGGKVSSGRLIPWAASFELLQAFILAHDDLIDAAPSRRGRHSLQKEFRVRGFSRAEALTLLGGDALYLLGLERLLDLPEEPSRIVRALRYLFAAGRKTVVAEVDHLLMRPPDLLTASPAVLETIYRGKTAHYSFIAPLVCGALTAGRDHCHVQRLERLGADLGVAFQLQDDLFDLYPGPGAESDESYEDIRNSRVTWIVVRAARESAAAERERLVNVFRKEKKTRADIGFITTLIERRGARKNAEERIRALLSRAARSLALLPLPDKRRLTAVIRAAFLPVYHAELEPRTE